MDYVLKKTEDDEFHGAVWDIYILMEAKFIWQLLT